MRWFAIYLENESAARWFFRQSLHDLRTLLMHCCESVSSAIPHTQSKVNRSHYQFRIRLPSCNLCLACLKSGRALVGHATTELAHILLQLHDACTSHIVSESINSGVEVTCRDLLTSFGDYSELHRSPKLRRLQFTAVILKCQERFGGHFPDLPGWGFWLLLVLLQCYSECDIHRYWWDRLLLYDIMSTICIRSDGLISLTYHCLLMLWQCLIYQVLERTLAGTF